MSLAELPILTSFAGFKRSWVKRDVIAGLTLWAVLVPEALAYATIAGVSPVVGLYAAPPALVLYAAFGSSKHLVVGPGAASAALSAAAVADLTTGGPENFAAFTAMLALVTGVLALVGRAVASRVPRQLHLRAGDEGLHHRARPDDHRRAAARRCSGSRRARATSSNKRGTSSAISMTRSGERSLVGVLSFAIVLGLRRFAPAVPGVARRGGVRHRCRARLRSRPARRRDRRPHRERAPVDRAPARAGLSDYFADVGVGGRHHARRASRRVSAPPRRTRPENHYEIDPNRELIGLGAANIGVGAVPGHGRERAASRRPR